MINKNEIIETAFNAIKSSLEWGCDCANGAYAYYIEGVVTMAEEMICKFDDAEGGLKV
jgi:hypothetical protein